MAVSEIGRFGKFGRLKEMTSPIFSLTKSSKQKDFNGRLNKFGYRSSSGPPSMASSSIAASTAPTTASFCFGVSSRSS